MKITKLTFLKVIAIAQIGSLQAADDTKQQGFLPTDVAEAVSSFSEDITTDAMLAIRTLDKSGDGAVPLTDLTKHLMSRGFAQRTSDFEKKDKVAKRKEEGAVRMDRLFLKSLKTDGDGNLHEEGFKKGLETALSFRLIRLVPLDIDKDDKLSLKEYAVGRPVREDEKKDAEGFTESQRQSFAKLDLNGDQFIQGAEYIGNLGWVRDAVSASMVSIYIDRADENEDGSLSTEELKALLPEANNLPEAVTLKESIHWLRTLKPSEVQQIKQQLLTVKK